MAGDTHGSDTVHTRYARKGTPTAMHTGQRTPSDAGEAEGEHALLESTMMTETPAYSAAAVNEAQTEKGWR